MLILELEVAIQFEQPIYIFVARDEFDAEVDGGPTRVSFILFERDGFARNFVEGEAPEKTRDCKPEFTLRYYHAGTDSAAVEMMS